MKVYQGRSYRDDRLFILDLSRAKRDNRNIWAVVTRRNCEGFPPFRIDEFDTREQAIEFIKRIEPTTPRISLGGQAPIAQLSYNDYCAQLQKEGLPSAMEIHELNRGTKREIIVDSADRVEDNNKISSVPTGNRFFYNYAHVALPILALGNPRKFYKDVSSGNGQRYLRDMWQGLAGKMGVNQPHGEMALTKKTLAPDLELFIIRMPRPTGVPEAFYIGIAFRIKKQLLGAEVVSARYFTLELGRNVHDQSEEYHFCEWVGGIQREHKNYGRLRDAAEPTFVEAIGTVL